jgi:ankyrin repeat protein
VASAKPLNDESTNSQNKNISPALTDAITKGNLRLCQQLIERGFGIDGTCDCGCTALVKACVHKRLEVAAYLLQLGASVEGVACSKEFSTAGFSALQLAARNEHFEIFESIFKKAPLVSEEIVQTLQYAASSGCVTILRFLLEHAADKRLLLEAGKPKIPDIENGHHFVSSEAFGYTRPLHVVVAHEHVEAIEILLRAGADLEARNEVGMTALQLAVKAHNPKEILDLLVKAGANLNTRDCGGKTPLMNAARARQGPKAVKYLINMAENDLDLQATDEDGCTALHHAIETENFTAAKLLIKAGLNPLQADFFGDSSIHEVVRVGNSRFALQNLPEVDNIRSKRRGSILNAAVHWGEEKVVTELLKKAPEKDVQEYINLPCDLGTPLYCAAYHGHIPIMDKLLEKGAQINLVGGPVGSPLVTACAMGHVQAVTLLLKKGAELQCTKFDGTTMTAEEAAQQHEAVLLVLRRFDEKGIEGLDEEIPIKTADISKLDEFMATYDKRTAGGYERSSDEDTDSGDENEDEKDDVQDAKTDNEKKSQPKSEANNGETAVDDENLGADIDKVKEA